MCDNCNGRVVIAAWALIASLSPGAAHGLPWEVYEDTLSASVCDVVNAANAELVVLVDTGQFVIVTGEDVILEDTFVDFDGSVYLETGIPGVLESVGFIDFADDRDGFR